VAQSGGSERNKKPVAMAGTPINGLLSVSARLRFGMPVLGHYTMLSGGVKARFGFFLLAVSVVGSRRC
jgi:hypothetical protein